MRTLQINELRGELAGIIQMTSMGSFAEVLRGPVLDLVRQGIRENFENTMGPESQIWPSRKKEMDGHPLLILSGTLHQEAIAGNAEVTDRELAVSTDLVYAATHEYGRAGAKIPARPYMGVSERHLDWIGREIGEHLDKLIRGI